MRILYDHQAFEMQSHGGVSRCFAELYKNLPKEISASISLKESNNVYINEINLAGTHFKRDGFNNFICRRPFPGKWHLYEMYQKILGKKEDSEINLTHSIKELQKGEFDIFHPTFYNDYFLPYLKGKPFVLTIHDMIPELYPQLYGLDHTHIILKRKLAPLAKAIIAVSENTKKDIIRFLNIPEEKVSVVYHGCSFSSPQSNRSPYSFPYILYVGDRFGYKNFIPFVKQVSPVIKQHKGLHVICTGKPFIKEEKEVFKELGVSQYFINTWVKTDAELYSLYHHAECFIYPSDYEGFGIPILEAYQADCPVLLNCASCFPEIAKDAAIYFNINSNNDNLSQSLEDFLSMNKYDKESLLTKQRARLSNFSWKESAERLARIYNSI